jgi:hypothetical protein
MVTEYPNPLGGPSAGHICAMASSPFVPHAQLNHLPLDDLKMWFGDQSMPCHTKPEIHLETPYFDWSTPQLVHQND